MARNRGKRPGTSSGPSSKPTNQPKKADQATGDAGTKPLGNNVPTSVSQTKMADEKTKGDVSKATSASTTATSSSKSDSASANVTSSPGKDGRPAAGTGSVPSSKAASAKTATGGASASAAAAQPAATGGSSSSGGFWPGLLGGLLGGAAVALAASLFWTGGDGLAKLQSTADDLDRRLSAAEGEVQAVGGLAARLDAVESDGPNSELADRFAAIEQQLGELGVEGSLTEGGSANGTAALRERLAALEQQLSDLAGTVASSSETQRSAGEAIASLQSALPTLETTLAATGTAIEETGQQTATLGEATERLGAEVNALSERVGQTESKLDYIGGAYQRAAAMVVAIGDVDRSIARAEPFEAALESLRALGQDDPGINEALANLEPMAAEGVPTLAGLKSSFGEVGSRILLAADGDQTLADQVSDNLFGIINMRPAGSTVEGDDSRAIVARTQAKLAADDLEGALAELAALNEAALASAGDWIADAKARLSADAAIVGLRAHAQSLLATGS